MIRTIIHIDEEKCNGCGICASACHEGAIEIVNGKAKLVRENFCDGLGDCLPGCPAGAITFEQREAPAYDEAAVNRHKSAQGNPVSQGSQIKQNHMDPVSESAVSRLKQWPVQMKLLPSEADIYEDADLLIAADCTAYAYADIHEKFMNGRITMIGCPKLDTVDYTEKLTAVLANNRIRSLTVLRMDVPCCSGIQRAAEAAMQASGRAIPYQAIIVSRDGKIRK